MGAKTTGAELKAFYNDPKAWSEDAEGKSTYWCDDVTLLVNGEEKGDGFSIHDHLKDADQVKILSGWVFSNANPIDGVSFDSQFRKWRKQQNTGFLAVEFPKEKEEAIKAAILAAGGKVV